MYRQYQDYPLASVPQDRVRGIFWMQILHWVLNKPHLILPL